MKEPKKLYIEQGIIRGTRSAIEMKSNLHDYEYISIEHLKDWIEENDLSLPNATERLLKYLNKP